MGTRVAVLGMRVAGPAQRPASHRNVDVAVSFVASAPTERNERSSATKLRRERRSFATVVRPQVAGAKRSRTGRRGSGGGGAMRVARTVPPAPPQHLHKSARSPMSASSGVLSARAHTVASVVCPSAPSA